MPDYNQDQVEMSQPTAQEPVQTGLVQIAASAASPTPDAPFIQIEEAPAPVAPPQAKTIAERPERTWKENQTIREEATTDDEKRRFYEQIVAAREPPPEKVATQPIAPRIVEQTRREMEAGAAQVAKAAYERALRPPPPPDPTNGAMTAVFRPESYVPDQKKGQGTIPNSTQRNL